MCVTDASKNAALFATVFGCDGGLIGSGNRVGIAVSVSEAGLIPAVSLFNGRRSLSTEQQSSPFVFMYELRSDDNGLMRFQVTASGDDASVPFPKAGCVAGMFAACVFMLLVILAALSFRAVAVCVCVEATQH